MTTAHSPTIGSLVWRLSLRWRAAVDRAVAPHGLTQATYSVLATLSSLTAGGAAPSQRELAEATGLDAVYISKLIRMLERDGFVERSPHPADTRAVQLRLTTAGATTISGAIDAVAHLHRELLAPLGGPRSAASRELKAALLTLLEETTTSTSPTGPTSPRTTPGGIT